MVRCTLCGDRSHPTSDCPQKRLGINENSNAHRDLREFIEEVRNKDIKDVPIPNNPMSHINFITEFSGGQVRALMNSASNPEKEVVGNGGKVTKGEKKMKEDTKTGLVFALPPPKKLSK